MPCGDCGRAAGAVDCPDCGRPCDVTKCNDCRDSPVATCPVHGKFEW